jgi:hypothetical protein
MRYAFLITLLALLVACGDDDDQATLSPSPSATGAAPTASPGVSKPDPESLLRPGHVLDQSLEVSLDGSAAGQIVVISHTTEAALRTEDPAAASVPPKGQCTSDTPQEGGSFDCLFQAEVFALDAASGWTSVFVTPDYASRLAAAEKSICGHRCGSQEMGEHATFALGDGREAVILAIGYCTGIGSGCGTYREVLTMREGEVKVAYTSWQGSVEVAGTSAVFNNAAPFRDDAGCCPSGRRIETLALDTSTGELGVIESRLLVCSEGTLAQRPAEAYVTNGIVLSCDWEYAGSAYRTTGETVVEPAGVGGLDGLAAGDRIRVAYREDCEADRGCALVATKVTVLGE